MVPAAGHARPPTARAARTPRGGEAFAVSWAHGTVRGRVYGDWGNPTAYLVHGWGGWWQQLGAHVEPLLARGLCVVAFDAPSHGDSGPGAHGGSVDHVRRDGRGAGCGGGRVRPADAGRRPLGRWPRCGARPRARGAARRPRPASPRRTASSRCCRSSPRRSASARGPQQVMVRRAERRVGMPVAELDLLTMAATTPVAAAPAGGPRPRRPRGAASPVACASPTPGTTPA